MPPFFRNSRLLARLLAVVCPPSSPERDRALAARAMRTMLCARLRRDMGLED